MKQEMQSSRLERKDWGRYDALVRKSPHGSIFSLSTWEADEVYGVFKGAELIAGTAFRTTPHGMARYVDLTPWQGICARSDREGENLAIAETLCSQLGRDFGEVTLTLPPQWLDTRAFTWAGLRPEIRYTYRGYGPYEKRVKVPSDEPEDTQVEFLEDWRCIYYWKANEGGDHSYYINREICRAKSLGKDFDMVGCNSPNRSLFKRSFGGKLTPYIAVTNAETRDLRAMPLDSLRSNKRFVSCLPEERGRDECTLQLVGSKNSSLQEYRLNAVS